MGMYHCALENITDLVACRTESVIATGYDLSVDLSSIESGWNRRNVCPYRFVLQHEMTRLPCTAERK